MALRSLSGLQLIVQFFNCFSYIYITHSFLDIFGQLQKCKLNILLSNRTQIQHTCTHTVYFLTFVIPWKLFYKYAQYLCHQFLFVQGSIIIFLYRYYGNCYRWSGLAFINSIGICGRRKQQTKENSMSTQVQGPLLQLFKNSPVL